MRTACAINLDLFTSVCRKLFKVDTAKGINTPTEVIIIDKQRLCIEKDAHTWESIVAKLLWNKCHCDLLRSGRLAKIVRTIPLNPFEYSSKLPGWSRVLTHLGLHRADCCPLDPRNWGWWMSQWRLETMPLKLLLLRSNDIKLLGSVLMMGPMSPFSWLNWKLIYSRFWHLPSSVGILPPVWVLSRIMYWRLSKLPMLLGIDP